MYSSVCEKGIYSFSRLWFISKYINWAQILKKLIFPEAQRGNNQDKKLPLLVQKKRVRLYFSIPPQLPKIGIAIFLGSTQLTVLSRVSINILNS